MDDDLKIHFTDLLALIGESFNRMEMILVSDGTKESKLAILKEIALSQTHLKAASAFLAK
jgi:hypothetical protein